MAGLTEAIRAGVPFVTRDALDRVFVVLAGWLMTGVFLDAWAHISGLPDSFWTPWHGVLYSGLVACGAFLVVAKAAERASGAELLSPGYDLSLVGFAIASLGGVADAVWHTVFGVEFDVEAAVSPSHLAIAGGILLVVTGPARAAIERRSFGLTGALGLLYGLSILTVILDYANPFNRVAGAAPAPATGALIQAEQTIALFAFMLNGALLAAMTLLALRRVRVAPVWPALVVGGNGIAMAFVNGPLLGAHNGLMYGIAIAGALGVGAAAAVLRPGPDRPDRLRAFAFLMPTTLYVAYAVGVIVAVGTWWSVTFWSGLVATGGLAGFLVAAVAVPGTRSSPL